MRKAATEDSNGVRRSVSNDLADGSRAGGIQVIARAADILRALKDPNRGMSLGQIAERVGLPRSTVQRIINALIAEGLVMMSSPSSGYRLGPEIQSLAKAGLIDAAEVLRPILSRAARTTGETVDLAVMRNGAMIFIDQIAGSHRLRAVSAVGEVFPMATTANGKAALSLCDEAMARSILARELKGDATAVESALAELAAVRQRGYAVDHDEHTEGISAIGSAVRDATGVVYAVSIPVPTQRFEQTLEELTGALAIAMADIRKVGFS